jgi:transposase
VYLDESGFEPYLTRRYAYAPQGQRVHGVRSGCKRPRPSLIAARIGERRDAPLLFTGHCNAELFNRWLAQVLCPLWRAEHVVGMDNGPFHKQAQTKPLIAPRGATLLYLPPYSPDLYPMEKDFATLKKLREYNAHDSLDTLIKVYR